MSKLIIELTEEHKQITSILNKLQNAELLSPKTKELLNNSKLLFLSHLEKEDTLLYPPLYKKAESDASLARTLEIYSLEMDKITEFVTDFYHKHTSGNTIKKSEFIMDLTFLILKLQGRIMKEELVIYTEYNKLKRK